MADIEDYLQEGFDPNKVTVPRLRSILVTHNIEYPANAKKTQLVELVEDHVLSQAPKLRAERARAKRSSLGIVNAGSAEDNGLWDDYDLPPPPQSTRRSKSPRKASSRVKNEDHVLSTPAPHRSPTKRGTRSVSRALSQADDHDAIEYEAPQSVRRSRRTVTPQIKPEPEDDRRDNVFTYDNPFQSGSSPAATKTPTNRRRTTGNEVTKSARPSSRRRTDNYRDDYQDNYEDNYQDDYEETPRPLQYRPITPDLLEPGEEFTPDAQLELEEAASRGEAQLAQPRKKPRQVARRTSFKMPLIVLFLAVLGAYLAWYRQEKIAVGYCSSGRPAKPLVPAEVPVPDFLVPFVEPQCENCPAHAFCYGDMIVRCKDGFLLKEHPLSLKGLIPLPPTCEADGEKARRVQAVADRAIEELRTRRAQFECGDIVTEDGKTRDSPVIPEQELKETVSRKRSKRLNKEEFDDLWAAAIGEVTARDEIEVVATEAPAGTPDLPNRRLSSTSLARLPFTCAFRRSFRLSLERYRLPAGLLVVSIFVVFYMRARYRSHVAISAQVRELVELVLTRLAKQKELGEEGVDEAWLFLPNLRDDVLRSLHSLSERERIWKHVRAIVEQNSNVRTGQREGRSGELARAWEWIGPLPITGESARRRRRSARMSRGPENESESPSREAPDVKKWEEARPIY